MRDFRLQCLILIGCGLLPLLDVQANESTPDSITLTNAHGVAVVDALGAHVVSYVPRGGSEVFFRQAGAHQAGSWYHGGVPICWPWFGRNGEPGSKSHGFAKDRRWRLDLLENGSAESRAVFGLEEKGAWKLSYEVLLNRSLTVRLSIWNLGSERFVVTTGLHPYFSVSDPSRVSVRTPDGSRISVHAGMDGDRPFGEGEYEVCDSGTGRLLRLNFSGNNKIVVWNPGPDREMPGLAADDWRRYVCVEPGVLPRCDGFYLNPGERRCIGMSCEVIDSGFRGKGI